MMVAWINQFHGVWFYISHILSVAVAYFNIIPTENFMKPVWRWKMQI